MGILTNGVLLLWTFHSISTQETGSFQLKITIYNSTQFVSLDNVTPLNEQKYLNFSNFRIKHLAADSLSELSQITHLDLSNNEITELPTYVFSSLINLEQLALTNYENPIQISGQFPNLDKLRVLDFSNTNAIFDEQTPFFGLPDDCEIIISKNMTTINPVLFFAKNSNQVHYLDSGEYCSYTLIAIWNLLQEYNSQIKRKKKLPLYGTITGTVCIAHGVVQVLEPNSDKKGCDEVNFIPESLSLNSRKIKAFEKNWYRLSNFYSIWELLFENNEITDIGQNLFNDLPKSVIMVSLKGNKIRALKNNIIINDHLAQLDMSENGIESIDNSAFAQVPSLTKLYLARNNINSLNFVLSIHHLLTLLDLTGNKITDIPNNTFSHLPNINFLNLSNNAITHLNDQSFSGVSRINTLNLGNNAITSIHKGVFDELRCTRELILSGNKIEAIEKGFVQNLNNIRNLYLNDSVKITNYQKGLLYGLPLNSTVYISSVVKSIQLSVFGKDL